MITEAMRDDRDKRAIARTVERWEKALAHAQKNAERVQVRRMDAFAGHTVTGTGTAYSLPGTAMPDTILRRARHGTMQRAHVKT